MQRLATGGEFAPTTRLAATLLRGRISVVTSTIAFELLCEQLPPVGQRALSIRNAAMRMPTVSFGGITNQELTSGETVRGAQRRMGPPNRMSRTMARPERQQGADEQRARRLEWQ